MTPHFVAKQLSDPRGIFGRVIVRLMNRFNARINDFTVEQLAPTKADRVLEIGFGGGATLRPLIERAGFVVGVDRSPYVIHRVKKRFGYDIISERAEFHEADVEALPFKDGEFTRVCTVNTVYFWRSLESAFVEIHRVLSPGGRLAVGLLPKEHMDKLRMPADVFTARTPEDVITALTSAGFTDVRAEHPRPTTPWVVIVANR